MQTPTSNMETCLVCGKMVITGQLLAGFDQTQVCEGHHLADFIADDDLRSLHEIGGHARGSVDGSRSAEHYEWVETSDTIGGLR
jgi:hypothetical protein